MKTGSRGPVVIYVCARCGAECRQLWWEAIGLEEAEAKCPGCGEWAEFEAREQMKAEAA